MKMWKGTSDPEESLKFLEVDEQEQSIRDLQAQFTQVTTGKRLDDFEETKQEKKKDEPGVRTKEAPFDLRLSRHNWLVICEFLELKDLVHVTSLCRASFELLSDYPIKNRIQLNSGSRKWLQRSKVILKSCKNVRVQDASSEVIISACFSRSRHLVLTSANRTFSVWHMNTIDMIGDLEHLPSTINALCALPEPTHMAMGLFNAEVRVYDVLSKDLKILLSTGDVSIISMCLDKESRLLVGTVGRTISVWDIQQRKKICTMSDHLSIITALILETYYGYVISGSFDARIKVWDTLSCKIIHTFPVHSSVNCLAALTQGGFASGSYDSSIDIWSPCDASSAHSCPYELVMCMEGKGHVVRSLCQIADDILVSGDHDRAINVWNIEKGEHLESHFVHTDWIYDVQRVPSEAASVLTVSADKSFCITALDADFNIHEPAPFDYESLWEVGSQGDDGDNLYIYDPVDFHALKIWSLTKGVKEVT